MKVSECYGTTVSSPRIEWSDIKDRLPIEMVATNLLGPASRRQGNRLFWPCPFHEDHHPSFDVNLTKKVWYCRVCGIGGDAAELVKRVNGCDFPAAVKFLADLSGVVPSSTRKCARSRRHHCASHY